MSRILAIKEVTQRREFSRKAMKIEDAFNELILKAHEAGIAPDVSIWVRPDVLRPVIKICFFRDSDSTQNEQTHHKCRKARKPFFGKTSRANGE